MKSAGLEQVERFVSGEIDLIALEQWADGFGRKAFNARDPEDCESLYLAVLVQHFRNLGVPPHSVYDLLYAQLNAGGGI